MRPTFYEQCCGGGFLAGLVDGVGLDGPAVLHHGRLDDQRMLHVARRALRVQLDALLVW